ncbi:amino acid adenylation domain-containing protein [Anaerocolumna xylanovorans]|uniref:Amino acid adenylation domain-containing protein n=1 Tax=Anaerocolumna xylanovorans DSM 12503 TaxID=1121345 RepID=A0A1M7XZ77_9FIRM|nr:amino acid adenylation domain-containing protein [Anaerocolumna xylanovorans]SHO44480.1 amino acid adenylation domain-containing protein [Anaerocolumna xylanovorans DSM 12503]
MNVENTMYRVNGVNFFIEGDKKGQRTYTNADLDFILEDALLTKINEFMDRSHCSSDEMFFNLFLVMLTRFNKNSYLQVARSEQMNGEAIQRQLFDLTFDQLENITYQGFLEFVQSEMEKPQKEEAGKQPGNSKALKIGFTSRKINLQENSGFDLLMIRDSVNRLRFCFHEQIIDVDYINAIKEGMLHMISDCCEDMQKRILDTALMTKESVSDLYSKVNRKEAFDFTKSLYEMFEQQVKQTPEKIACIYLDEDRKEQRITYQQLDAKSSYLANKLQELGVKKEVAVGVYTKRSIQTFISILGILKAGGIYLPLDLSYPNNYINNILDEINPKVIIANHELAKNFETDITIFDIDCLSVISDEVITEFHRENTLNSTAIIMYTSGSTGRPKGVKHKQLQVINRINFLWSNYPFQEEDVIAQRTTINYMPSMWELFGGLLKGITTVIISDILTKDPNIFLRILQDYHITYLTIVPSLFRMMSSSKEVFEEFAKNVRVWICCGEPLTIEIFNTFQQVLPNSVLINDYGATEVNGFLYFDSESDRVGENMLPRFRPVSNVNFYILDEALRPTPIGIPGCIYIGGPVVSTGYVNNEELNNEKFIDNPLKCTEDRILFKLGDRALFHKDGSVEALGRNDNQVKVRGIRVDIEGIEHILQQSDMISNAVIAVKEQKSGNKYLEAYIVCNRENVTEELIRKYLEENIPAYMIPARFCFVNRLPLLPNGKVDRKGVLKMGELNQLTAQQIETVLMKDSAEILGISEKSINSAKKFYEVGFDSVSIVSLLAKVNEKFNKKITISDMYDNSTISSLAKHLEGVTELNPDYGTEDDSLSNVSEQIITFISDIIDIDRQYIDRQCNFQEMGLKTQERNKLLDKLKDFFGLELSLLEINLADNIEALAKMIQNHPGYHKDFFAAKREAEYQEKEKPIEKEEPIERGESEERKNEVCFEDQSGTSMGSQEKENGSHKEFENKIAVIGMSCVLPGAPDKETLWENLAAGISSITEIPKERFDVTGYYSENGNENTTNSKWGGFIKEIDLFDAGYFGISEYEATLMDPQQKVCLEETCKALEDSGYSLKNVNGKRIGVFIGARQGDYKDIIREQGIEASGYSFMGADSAIISARISYLLDLKGPCLTIDTACSSSLTAIHEASNSIKLEECDMAIAGGVFVMNTPYLYINSAQMGMLSRDGRCKTFDNEANGFVPGEGAGIVILKSLKKAVEDNDRIYGVIEGSLINQDGKTNGITAPSADAQRQLEEEVYKKGKIDPSTISYVEAHGTGTKLGDPIEIKALTDAFRKWTQRKNYCAIGSIKTNIGHTVATAGVAGLIKILLCIQKKELPASLNYRECNSFINFEDSPFYVNQSLIKWEPQNEVRRAALSSYGFGGSNCHMVIGEYSAEPMLKKQLPYVFIPVSAKTENAFVGKCNDLVHFLEQSSVQIGDLARSLCAREEYEYREAFIVSDKEDLLRQLSHYIKQGHRGRYVQLDYKVPYDCFGQLVHGGRLSSEEYKEMLVEIRTKYIYGLELDLSKYYQYNGYGIISLPAYPYQKRKLYLQGGNAGKSNAVRQADTILSTSKELDCVHNRISVKQICREYYYEDHILNGTRIFPGAAYIDFLYQSYREKYKRNGKCIKNLCFLKSINSTQQDGYLDLVFKEEDNYTTVQVVTLTNGEKTIHAMGELSEEKATGHSRFSIPDLKNKLGNYMSGSKCYETFLRMGLEYKETYHLIEEIYFNQSEAISKLLIPSKCRKEYAINPHILDAAFQTVMPLLHMEEETKNTYIPFSIKEMELSGNLDNAEYIYAFVADRQENYDLQKYHIEILDKEGNVLASIKEFTRKRIHTQENEMHYYQPVMVRSEQEERCEVLPKDTYLLVFDTDNDLSNQAFIRRMYDNRVLYVSHGRSFLEQIGGNQYTINQMDANDYKTLFLRLKEKNIIIDRILYFAAYYPGSEWSVDIESELEKSIYSVTYLVQGYLHAKPEGSAVLYAFYDSLKSNGDFYRALNGFAKCLPLEQYALIMKNVDLPECIKGSADFYSCIEKELLLQNDDTDICYKKRIRYAAQYQQMMIQPAKGIPMLKTGGVYLITGALGGIGRKLTKYLADRYDIKLILLGKREITKEQLIQIFQDTKNLKYYSVDLADRYELGRILELVRSQYGNLQGIFHCAGRTGDSFLVNKTKEAMSQVFAPKVQGLYYLGELTRSDNLEFLVCFSSIAAVTGNQGQSDYAYANAFMDSYAFRNGNGRIISIDWSLWMDGGMGSNPDVRESIEENFGIVLFSEEEGIQALANAMEERIPNLVVVKGDRDKIRNVMQKGTTAREKAANKDRDRKSIAGRKEEHNKADQSYELLKEIIVSELLELSKKVFSVDKLDCDASFDDQKIDSVSLMEFAKLIYKKLGIKISPAALFEYNTIHLLADNLIQKYEEELRILFSVGKEEEQHIEDMKEQMEESIQKIEQEFTQETEHIRAERGKERSTPCVSSDIAIIGMSLRMPKANDINEFWDNIAGGKECISETPKNRWDYEAYDDKLKDYLRFGGYLEDIDTFDSLFFHISPEEAKLMDPQQRILMEETYRCIENAGIRTTDLDGRKIGVFIGAFSNDYQQLLSETEYAQDVNVIAGNDHAMLANRISYHFNLHGASEVIDTACSSSLVAVYRAMNAIKSGEIEAAIVGGVNIVLNPAGTIKLGKLGFLNSSGIIKSFDENADGYVRGEGVGVLFLKSLPHAVEHGDRIHAVIKGGAINHGGRGHYIMEPNALAEAQVIKEAYANAKIEFGTVNYIEAHGTGTKVGDMNEIYAFQKAFREMSSQCTHQLSEKFCGIGTVKPNIGHLEAASGMASVIKLILALKKKQIPASLHYQTEDKAYELEHSFFYMNDQLTSWNQLVDQDGRLMKRRGEVHAYGYGGTNAHLILEEYEEEANTPIMPYRELLFIFSANTKQSLDEYLICFVGFLENVEEEQLGNVAYTLMMGRNELKERISFIARDKSSLTMLINNYLEGIEAENVITQGTDEDAAGLQSLFAGRESEEILMLLIRSDNLRAIANLYVHQIKVDWKQLYPNGERKQIELPTYRFEKIHHFVNLRNKDYPIAFEKLQEEETTIVQRERMDTLDESLSQLIGDCLGLSNDVIRQCKNLNTIGLNSIMLAKIKFEMEKKYQIKMISHELADKNSFLQLKEYVKSRMDKPDDLKEMSEEELDMLFDSMKG